MFLLIINGETYTGETKADIIRKVLTDSKFIHVDTDNDAQHEFYFMVHHYYLIDDTNYKGEYIINEETASDCLEYLKAVPRDEYKYRWSLLELKEGYYINECGDYKYFYTDQKKAFDDYKYLCRKNDYHSIYDYWLNLVHLTPKGEKCLAHFYREPDPTY